MYGLIDSFDFVDQTSQSVNGRAITLTCSNLGGVWGLLHSEKRQMEQLCWLQKGENDTTEAIEQIYEFVGHHSTIAAGDDRKVCDTVRSK